MNIMKNKLLFTTARIQNCWVHHQEGSDWPKNKKSHLFSLVCKDFMWAIKGVETGSNYLTWWVDEYEEREVIDVLKSEHEFREYWDEINVLEIIHAAIQTEDKGDMLVGKNRPALFAKAPEGYFKKRGQVQGFLTSEHKFVDRFEAAKIAVEAGQIEEELIRGRAGLISENLWVDSGFLYDPAKGYYKESETLKIKTW